MKNHLTPNITYPAARGLSGWLVTVLMMAILQVTGPDHLILFNGVIQIDVKQLKGVRYLGLLHKAHTHICTHVIQTHRHARSPQADMSKCWCSHRDEIRQERSKDGRKAACVWPCAKPVRVYNPITFSFTRIYPWLLAIEPAGVCECVWVCIWATDTSWRNTRLQDLLHLAKIEDKSCQR